MKIYENRVNEKSKMVAEIAEKITEYKKTCDNFNDVKKEVLKLLMFDVEFSELQEFLEIEVDLSVWYDVLNIDKIKKVVDSYTDESVTAEFQVSNYIVEFLANEIFKNRKVICNAICDRLS